MTTRKFILIVFSFFLFINNSNAQEKYKQSSQDVIKLIKESQNHYSTDDELINGCIYPLPNSRVQGDPYLKDNWSEAIIYIGGKSYTNQFIKYDVVIGDVILQAQIEDGVPKLVNLNKFMVDSFLVGNTLFVNPRIMQIEDENYSYLEQIYKGKYSLYKEYKKNFIKEYNNITPYGKYSSLKTDLFLLKNNNLSGVNRKSSFLESFDKAQQSEIKTFMNKNKTNYKKASIEELKQLMIFCTKTSSN